MASDPPPLEDETAVDSGSGPPDFGGESQDELGRQATEPTMPLVSDTPPQPAPLALVAAGRSAATPVSVTPSVSLTSAADAMRNEEIERTRLFIIMGWVLSVIAACTVPFVDAPRSTTIVFVGGLGAGIMLSSVFWRRFADPMKYTEPALLALA